jgi:cytochrome c peroxidase
MKKSVLSLLILPALMLVMVADTIDLDNLFTYANQSKPAYIVKDNTPANNVISNAGATLGRVLFYDKQLSLNNTIACASCHKQEFAFGDTAQRSVGLNGGLTGRHSMRLINSRFGTEAKFFWDERAASLENQTTQPIRDHVEMGFSGTNGNPDFDSLVNRLASISYYQQLFTFVYGSPQVTEAKIQFALAQFIRSIQSFDSKFDAGRALAPNDAAPFANFTADENAGKQLFLAPPPQGGAGCQGCHRAPEFDIDPNTLNNGVIQVAGNPGAIDLTNTRAPSLRDVFNSAGQLNGPLMHNGMFTTIEQVIDHYNLIPPNPQNTNIDPRVAGPGGNLQLTAQQKNQLIAFLKTLSGTDVYSNPKWSNPFDSNGGITILPLPSALKKIIVKEIEMFPNPARDYFTIRLSTGNHQLQIFNQEGRIVMTERLNGTASIDINTLPAGVYFIRVNNVEQTEQYHSRLVKL